MTNLYKGLLKESDNINIPKTIMNQCIKKINS